MSKVEALVRRLETQLLFPSDFSTHLLRSAVHAALELAAEEMRGLFGHDINAMYAAINRIRSLIPSEKPREEP